MPKDNDENKPKETIAQLKARLASQGFTGVATKKPPSPPKHRVADSGADTPEAVDIRTSPLNEADMAEAAKEVESEVKLTPAEMRAKLGLPPATSGGPRMPLGGIMGGVKLNSVKTKVVEAKGKVIDALPEHGAPTQAAPTQVAPTQAAPPKAPNFAAAAAGFKLKSRPVSPAVPTEKPKPALSPLQQKLADRRAAEEAAEEKKAASTNNTIDMKSRLAAEKSSNQPSAETKKGPDPEPTQTNKL